MLTTSTPAPTSPRGNIPTATDISRHLANHPASPMVVELLLTLPDRRRHEAQLLKRAADEPDRNGSRHLEHLDTIRALQDMLQHDARRAGVHEYDVGELSDLTQFIVDQVVARDEPAIQPGLRHPTRSPRRRTIALNV